MTTPARLLTVLLALAAAAPALGAEVDRRQRNQQERIGQGVQSGQLTPGEAARLERQQARIDRQIQADRAANGGHLTPAERAQIHREQDRASRRIYARKHS